MNVVKSFSRDEDEIITSIMALHNDGKPFDVDPCFSKGSFYAKGLARPRHRFDIMPVRPDVQRCDVRCLPLQDGSVGSVIFDPPFMFNPHGTALTKNAAAGRFTMFETWDELVDCYTGALAEFWRVLRPGGIVAFKCQDYTDSRTTLTHCWVWRWALETGLYVKDLFIRVRDHGPAYNPALRQKHARKFHSYWLVLEKPQRRIKAA